MEQLHRRSTTGVFRPLALVVLLDPTVEVCRVASIERAIGTFDDIHVMEWHVTGDSSIRVEYVVASSGDGA
jgi:hypothetical protein